MFRFSFLVFLVMYFCGSFFRTSIEETLLREAIHSFFPSNPQTEHHFAGRDQRSEHTLRRGCVDSDVCSQGQPEMRRTQRTDEFGDNGPLDRRYVDPT